MALIEVEETSPSRPRYLPRHRYVREPEPIEFPESEPWEEHVSETKRHLENRTALYLVLRDAFAATASIGCDQFVYWDPEDPRRCLSPDAFVKLGIPDSPFPIWKTWERGAPDLGVEIISKSDHRDDDWDDKLQRYRAAGIQEVVRYDATDVERPIRIWDNVGGDLVERAADDRDLLHCQTLDLWWCAVVDERGYRMLRLARDREGHDLLPTPDEARMEAERARRKAERAQREEEKARLEAEKARLDAERKLAQEQAARAQEQAARAEEQAAAAAEIERLKAELAKAKPRRR